MALEVQGLTEAHFGGFLRQRGLYSATLTEWRETVLRDARAEPGGRADKTAGAVEAKRIRELKLEPTPGSLCSLQEECVARVDQCGDPRIRF